MDSKKIKLIGKVISTFNREKIVERLRRINLNIPFGQRAPILFLSVNLAYFIKYKFVLSETEFIKLYNENDGGYSSENKGKTIYNEKILFPSSITSTYFSVSSIYKLKYNLNLKTPIYILSRFNSEIGSFNELSGESDMRINAMALMTLKYFDSSSLKEPISKNYINFLEKKGFNRKICIEWVEKSLNEDGGYGINSGGESHGAYTFCALVILKLLSANFKKKKTVSFLKNRFYQKTGGLNGRYFKLPDSCYYYWVNASLLFLGEEVFPTGDFLKNSYDLKNGFFAVRPNLKGDLFHTVYSIASILIEEKLIDEIFLV